MGQYWSIAVHIGPIWSIRIHIGVYWPLGINMGQYWSLEVNMGQYWSIAIHIGPIWSKAIHIGPIWSIGIQISPIWFIGINVGSILSHMRQYRPVLVHIYIWSLHCDTRLRAISNSAQEKLGEKNKQTRSNVGCVCMLFSPDYLKAENSLWWVRFPTKILTIHGFWSPSLPQGRWEGVSSGEGIIFFKRSFPASFKLTKRKATQTFKNKHFPACAKFPQEEILWQNRWTLLNGLLDVYGETYRMCFITMSIRCQV